MSFLPLYSLYSPNYPIQASLVAVAIAVVLFLYQLLALCTHVLH